MCTLPGKDGCACGIELMASQFVCSVLISALSCLRVDVPAELRRDDYPAAGRSQSLTHEFLIREWPIRIRRVEERHAGRWQAVASECTGLD